MVGKCISPVRICLQTRKDAQSAEMHLQNIEKLQSQKIAPIHFDGLGQEKSLEISAFRHLDLPKCGFLRAYIKIRHSTWYRDLSEEMDKYNGKVVKFKGLIARDPKMPANMTLAGRHVMTCCEADIAFHPLVCVFDGPTTLKTRDWAMLTGKIRVEENKFYRTAGPVLYVSASDFAVPPVQEVATVY